MKDMKPFLSENKWLILFCVFASTASVVLFSYSCTFREAEPRVKIKFRDIEWSEEAKRFGNPEWEREMYLRAKIASTPVPFYGPTLPKKAFTIPKKRVSRFKWGSPASREEVWNIPKSESREATAAAFLRVCMSEASGNKPDCLGIWQVISSIRSKKCDREWIRNITECDENGETRLSAMRRASRSLLGMTPPKSRRQRWISKLELDCDPPRQWPRSKKHWENNYREICEDTVELAYNLVDGKRNYPWPVRRARPIAWGGRCESGDGACDDDIACGRGLARLYTKTLNAFWCRPGTRGCSDDIDPICLKRGFRSVRKGGPKLAVN